MAWIVGPVFCLLVVVTAVPRPPGIFPCPINDPNLEKCIQTQLNILIPMLAQGWYETVPSLDPLYLPMGETSYADGNMTLSLSLKNVSVKGLADTKVSIVKAKSLEEGKFELMCKTPSIKTTGSYRGEVFVSSLPLFSNGPFNVTLGDLTSHLVVHLESQKGHLRVKDIGLNVMPSLIDVQASKQLDDDNDLGITLNVYLNENSFELYNIIRPSLMDFFSDLLKNIANTLLQEAPDSAIFPNLDLQK